MIIVVALRVNLTLMYISDSKQGFAKKRRLTLKLVALHLES